MSDASASDIIENYLTLLRRPLVTPEVAVSFLSTSLPARTGKPCALVLSPHPDDECLAGALPLRLKRELGWQVVNIAVTLGSDGGRRAARGTELARACAVAGFDCLLAKEDGFFAVTANTREKNTVAWTEMVARVAAIIAHCQPQMIILPHACDAHPTHIGTHLLGMDALAAMPAGFVCAVAYSEYWQPNPEPNLMVGLAADDAAVLLAALSCHTGENARNAFAARFPAYLIDNVRRGSEQVGGKGVASAPMDFAMLYKFGAWKNGKFISSALNRIVGLGEGLADLVVV